MGKTGFARAAHTLQGLPTVCDSKQVNPDKIKQVAKCHLFETAKPLVRVFITTNAGTRIKWVLGIRQTNITNKGMVLGNRSSRQSIFIDAVCLNFLCAFFVDSYNRLFTSLSSYYTQYVGHSQYVERVILYWVMEMISYDPFYKTLLRKNITEYHLIYKQGISANILHRMKHGKNITLKTLDTLCFILNCDVSDIIEYRKDI